MLLPAIRFTDHLNFILRPDINQRTQHFGIIIGSIISHDIPSEGDLLMVPATLSLINCSAKLLVPIG